MCWDARFAFMLFLFLLYWMCIFFLFSATSLNWNFSIYCFNTLFSRSYATRSTVFGRNSKENRFSCEHILVFDHREVGLVLVFSPFFNWIFGLQCQSDNLLKFILKHLSFFFVNGHTLLSLQISQLLIWYTKSFCLWKSVFFLRFLAKQLRFGCFSWIISL